MIEQSSHPRSVPCDSLNKRGEVISLGDLVSRSIFCNGTLPRSPLRKLINCETDSTPVESTSWLIIRSNELMAGRNNSHAYSIHRQIDGRVNEALAALEYCYWMQTALHWLNIWLGECQLVLLHYYYFGICACLMPLVIFVISRLINRVLDLLLELR